MAEYIVDARPSDLFGIKMTGLLVRCKDCKYCREAHYEEDGEPPIIKLKCENKYGLCRYQAEPDGFCSHGELKDGDGE